MTATKKWLGMGMGGMVAAVVGAGVVGGQTPVTPKGEVQAEVSREGAASAREEAMQKEIEALRERVEAQRAYIEQLERELGRLKGKKPEAVPAPLPAPVPPSPPLVPAPEVPGPWLDLAPRVPGPGEGLPRGWQEREFNGLKYYLVPLKREGKE